MGIWRIDLASACFFYDCCCHHDTDFNYDHNLCDTYILYNIYIFGICRIYLILLKLVERHITVVIGCISQLDHWRRYRLH